MRKLLILLSLTIVFFVGTAAMRASNLAHCTVTVQNAPEGMEVKVFILEEDEDNPDDEPNYVYLTQAAIDDTDRAYFYNLPKGFTYAFITTYVAGYTTAHSYGHTITTDNHTVTLNVQRID